MAKYIEINGERIKPPKSKLKIDWYYVFTLSIIMLWMISMCSLIVWGFVASFRTPGDFNNDPLLLPKRFTFENYIKVFAEMNFEIGTGASKRPVYIEEMFLNSVIYAGGSALLNVFVPMVTGYAIGRYRFRFGEVIYTVVLICMALPIVGSLPSQIEMFKTFGMYNTRLGLPISQANFLSIYTLLFCAFFKGVAREYYEAAQIDGASEWYIMTKVLVPLCRNLFFTLVLIKFVQYWNDYSTPLVFQQDYPTIAYGIFQFSFSTDTDLAWDTVKMAGTMVMLVPTLTIFIIFHNKFLTGVSMGGIKE